MITHAASRKQYTVLLDRHERGLFLVVNYRVENTFPKIKSMAFLMRKSFYCRPIENAFSKIKNVVFLMRKSFFCRIMKKRAGL